MGMPIPVFLIGLHQRLNATPSSSRFAASHEWGVAAKTSDYHQDH